MTPHSGHSGHSILVILVILVIPFWSFWWPILVILVILVTHSGHSGAMQVHDGSSKSCVTFIDTPLFHLPSAQLVPPWAMNIPTCSALSQSLLKHLMDGC